MSNFSGSSMPKSGLLQQNMPAITIYYRRKRILIHRSTIRVMGNPQYVRLLINPQEMKFAVQSCDRQEHRSFEVPENLFDVNSNAAFEITSTSLLNKIRECTDWSSNKTYRLYGEVKLQYSIVVFNLLDYYEVSDTAEE